MRYTNFTKDVCVCVFRLSGSSAKQAAPVGAHRSATVRAQDIACTQGRLMV